MPTDSLLHLLDDLEDARRTLIDDLVAFGDTIAETRRAYADGRGILEMVDGDGTAARERVVTSVQRFSRALARSRSAAVRALVNDHGWTFTQVAHKIGKTRQLVSRLYHDGA